MLTPQEVASHSFARATLGGYSMAMVDEFLDTLTEDYTALYNDNAILKNKLKVLSETVEEYRATDTAMRKTLLAAQQMADSLIQEAEQKKASMISEAEQATADRVAGLQLEIAAEEYRLQQAQQATAAYVRKLADMHEQELAFLASLQDLVPPEAAAPQDDPGADIEASVSALYGGEAEPVPSAEAESTPSAESDLPELDEDATKRFEDLQFGKDYTIQ